MTIAGRHVHLYFDTDDAARDAEALERRGVRFVRGLHDTPWGTREFTVLDDQGHTRYVGQPRDQRGP